MNVKELKQAIEQRTGVPASLLSGETAEENIAQAKALLAYKNDYEVKRPKSTKEQFADWLGAQQGEEPQDTAVTALDEIAEAYIVENGGYPAVNDGGEIDHTGFPDGRSTEEQFADWFGQKTTFDPFKDAEGWKQLF